MVRSFSCFNSSATAGSGGGSTAASLPTASSSRGTSNQSNNFDITGKPHNGFPRRLLEATSYEEDGTFHAATQGLSLARSRNVFIIGSLGIRITPANGWSSSNIMKTAHATENAPAIRAKVLVAVDGASRLNPKKITTSHKINAISNGFETDETACACTSARSSASCTIRLAASVLRPRCASSCGLR